MAVEFRIVLPKRKWFPLIFTILIKKELNKEVDIIERMYQKTISTWNNKPRFVKEIIFTRESAIARVRLDKRLKASKVYSYLDKGTKKRWALMSQDFSPKTTHRTIGSRQGSGKAVLRGRRAMLARGIPARKGIKAREFSKEISERRKREWEKKMKKAMFMGAKSVWK